MVWRVLGGFVPMLVGWLIFSGAIPVGSLALGSGGEYKKEIERPVEIVSHAVSDLALDPMAGTATAHLSSLPPIRKQKNDDGYSWFLMNGPDVIAEMVVTLTPAKDGAATLVRTAVKPGTMEKLAPAFATRDALGLLFANAIEAELDVFAPASERKGNAKARATKEANMRAAQIMANPMRAGLEAQKEYMRTQKEISEMEADMDALDAAAADAAYRSSSQTSFRAGQPMVDVSR